jgi:hypothetical protein
MCAIVEKWNQFAGPHGIRQDLFGIIDVISLDPERGVVGVQCCAGSGFKNHLNKLLVERHQETYEWLRTPGTSLELWGWRKLKLKRGGKATRWKPRILEITMEMLESPENE